MKALGFFAPLLTVGSKHNEIWISSLLDLVCFSICLALYCAFELTENPKLWFHPLSKCHIFDQYKAINVAWRLTGRCAAEVMHQKGLQ